LLLFGALNVFFGISFPLGQLSRVTGALLWANVGQFSERQGLKFDRNYPSGSKLQHLLKTCFSKLGDFFSWKSGHTVRQLKSSGRFALICEQRGRIDQFVTVWATFERQ